MTANPGATLKRPAADLRQPADTLSTTSEHAGQRVNMRAGNTLYSACRIGRSRVDRSPLRTRFARGVRMEGDSGGAPLSRTPPAG